MTSESELDVIKNLDNNNENKQELNNETSTNIEQTTIEQPTEQPKVEEQQQINTDKPKRGGRKKREVASETEIKTDITDNDNAIDTQPLFEQPVIIEGKRSRKPTSRLELSDLTPPKKELSIPQGHGKPLGDIEYINHQITHASTDALARMRNICFGRRASKTNIRKNLREFNGFEFGRDSEEYQRHLASLIKFKKDQLRSISDILGLPATGRNDEHAERILSFLMEPIDEGKKIPERKMSMRTTKKASTNSKESIHTDEDENGNEEKNENGDDDLFDFDEDEDEDESRKKGKDTDDDYIGSDEESVLNVKDDDPDDFVYKPGKTVPKKRPSIKRSRSGTTKKRKRGSSTPSKRGRKKSKITRNKKVENEEETVPTDTAADAAAPSEPMQTNDEENKKTDDVVLETKTDDLNNLNTTISEQTPTTTDIIPTTS